MRVPLPLIGPAYKARELPISAQVTKNLFPEVHSEGRNIISLHTFPGLKVFSTLSSNDRGMHVMNGVLYAVSGSTLYSVDSSGTATSIGTVTGPDFCDFADNGTQLLITTGATWYLYTVSGGLQSDPDTDLVNPTTVGYINSQFIFDNNDTTSNIGEFITSSAGDGSSISSLDFATAEAHPDDIKHIVVNNQLVHFFGSESMEPWYNSGIGRPPFDRAQGGVRPYGVVGPWAVDKLNEFIYFVDNNRVPRRMSSLGVEDIGTIPLASEWRDYVRADDCRVFCYILDKQKVMQVTFPVANRSWLYHEESNSWVQLSDGVDNARHRATSYQFVYGKHIVADHSNGKLYEMDFDTYTDNGNVIQRRRSTATIHGGLYGVPGKELFYDGVFFDMQTGEGLTTGQGVDPEVMIRYSDDRGRTWSAEIWYPLGVGGDYLKRVELTQQGSAYERIYELTFSDPTEFTLVEAWADIEVGA